LFRVGTSDFPVEPGRYIVYIALACPWASRITAGIDIMGLEDAIEVVSVEAEFQRTKPNNPSDGHMGWVFAKEKHGRYIGPDPVFNARTLRDVYEACGDDVGKFTTPLLVDKISRRIVNNESSEILRMLNHEFSAIARHPFDIYPVSLRASIDETNDWVYKYINNGVYRAGFAQSQKAYDEAVTELFVHMDKAETILSKMRYLCSDKRITEADIRLFETLVRFDHVYHTHFKCNVKRLRDYPNLLNYTREMYQLVPKTVDIDEIKKHYYTSHKGINPFQIIAKGPEFDFHLPHDRDEKFPFESKSN
jgi:glutathionyl-hydroquinone reductase